ncbi:MAG: helix-turn-helix transcriptional regulator [Acholeplasmatales bacterium]|nr:helix-turn-helix transcriptional regulator [Acholeplasmatales bacterium]
MKWSDAIKELRNKLLITQVELAELLGVSYASVNRYENGVYEPTMKIKRKLKIMFEENRISMEG